MKALLPAIKTAIKVVSLLAAQSDAYITPHPGWRPEGTASKCLGIHSNGMTRQEEAGEMMELKASVTIYGYAELVTTADDPLCGTNGVYALLDAAEDILTDNRLGLSEVQTVETGRDTPAELFQADETTWLARIGRTFIYTLERSSV